jgi:hypothetical protein
MSMRLANRFMAYPGILSFHIPPVGAAQMQDGGAASQSLTARGHCRWDHCVNHSQRIEP